MCGGPGMGAGWSLKGQALCWKVPDMKLEDEPKPMYEGTTGLCSSEVPMHVAHLMVTAAVGKQRELAGVPLSLHCLFSLTSYTFSNYIWKRVYHYPSFMNEELDAQ